MSEYIQYEIVLFFKFSCIGAVLLLFYDLLLALKTVLPHGKAAAAAEDLLFWIFAALFVFGAAYRTNQGSLRSFLLLGLFLGVLLCHCTVSPFFLRIWIIILRIPVFFVKITIKRLLFLRERGKILVHNMEKSVSQGKKNRTLQKKRGRQVEKKEKKKPKQNSE